MKKKKLPDAQLTILHAINNIALEDLEAPTIPELAVFCSFGTTWTHLNLNSLEQEGYITRSKQWRSLRVTRKGKLYLRKHG